MKTIKEAKVENKKVLMRCDFNVPQDEQGNILDDFRIKETLPTIKYLIESKAKVILMTHLGDPDGKVVDVLKLDKVCARLSELLGMNVEKTEDCVGKEVEDKVNSLKEGDVILLENVRFHKEETDNEESFAKELAKLGDIYVNEAFSVCHRNHASVAGVPMHLPSYAGFLLEKEVTTLKKVMENPEKPMVAIIGGKKVETKTKVINKMSAVADFVLVSGLIKKEALEKNIVFDFPEKVVGPMDNLGALDIDEQSVELFKEKIKIAKTILWNGPFGKTEDEAYAKGTMEIAKAIVDSKAYSVVGGGETVEFLDREKMLSDFSHVCTGGGAMLSFLSGDILPGLRALE